MRFVAIQAPQAFFHMKSVLSYRGLVLMTFAAAHGHGGNYLPVRLMTLMAAKVCHRAFRREILMAFDTCPLGDHGRCLFGEGMAFQTGKCFHSNPVYAFIFMAVLTGIFIRAKNMECALMAYLALYALHKNMPCMAVGFFHRHRALHYVVHVTVFAGLPGLFPSMRLFKRLFSFHHIGH